MADNPDYTPSPEPAHSERADSFSLPPKPSAGSGQPFPPHAPAYSGTEKGAPELDRDRITILSRKPQPPKGQGSTLAWYQASPRKGFFAVLWTYVLVIAGLFIVRGFSTDWFHVWWLWVGMAALSLLAYPITMKDNYAAGAEWVMVNKDWALTYELVSVKAYTYSNSLNLHFVDSGGRTLKANISRFQDDRRIWDLLYNGILHSVVINGAETNQLARGTLKLPASN